jgi:hypothetical protein
MREMVQRPQWMQTCASLWWLRDKQHYLKSGIASRAENGGYAGWLLQSGGVRGQSEGQGRASVSPIASGLQLPSGSRAWEAGQVRSLPEISRSTAALVQMWSPNRCMLLSEMPRHYEQSVARNPLEKPTARAVRSTVRHPGITQKPEAS